MVEKRDGAGHRPHLPHPQIGEAAVGSPKIGWQIAAHVFVERGARLGRRAADQGREQFRFRDDAEFPSAILDRLDAQGFGVEQKAVHVENDAARTQLCRHAADLDRRSLNAGSG